ncbi:MAG: VanZ family protein [Burkholderiales bacterium PBB6]|nr:MAG: VanZ family protein [Burkholderiales bacterium PBB6]
MIDTPTRGALWRRWAVAVFAAAMGCILVIALLPGGGGPDWFPQADKLRHASAFIALWALGSRVPRLTPWRLVAVLLAFGAGIEVAQSFTTWREASVLDWVADAAGVAVGALLLRFPQDASHMNTAGN